MWTKTVLIIAYSMQLTRAADYAVRVMIHLASQPEGAVVSKTVLAKASEAPESFLSKILQTLARAGLIQARRGVEGGFLLLPRGAQSVFAGCGGKHRRADRIEYLSQCGRSCHRRGRLRRAPGLAAGADGDAVGSARGKDRGDGASGEILRQRCGTSHALPQAANRNRKRYPGRSGCRQKQSARHVRVRLPPGRRAQQARNKNKN